MSYIDISFDENHLSASGSVIQPFTRWYYTIQMAQVCICLRVNVGSAKAPAVQQSGNTSWGVRVRITIFNNIKVDLDSLKDFT